MKLKLKIYEVTPRDKYDRMDLPKIIVDAIENPGVLQTVTTGDPNKPGDLHTETAIYRGELEVHTDGVRCPSWCHHHLHQTCWRCGRYG